MRISKKKREDLFEAISEIVMDLRIQSVKLGKGLTEKDLFLLDVQIFDRVCDVLNIKA